MTRLFLAALFTLNLFATTIVISDIDDTIKVAHIKSTTDKIFTAFKTKNIFLGMADLYEKIQMEQNAKFFYVSNAPEKLMKNSHSKLLSNGHFPKDGLFLRPKNVDDKNHKIIAIEKLLNDHKPTNVILFGDNGENDVYFYKDIEDKYPNINFTTFIRVAYDIEEQKATPSENQFGFISPFEVADILYYKGIISKVSLEEIYKTHGPGFLKDKMDEKNGPLYLPEWLSCKGHVVNFGFSTNSNQIKEVQNKAMSICE